MIEGWLRGIKKKREKKKLSFVLYLKDKDGNLVEVEDPESYEFIFWVDTSINLEKLLKEQKFKHLTLDDIKIEKWVRRYHNGERKDLIQITVKNPFYKSEIVNYLKRLKKSIGGIKGIIGADRSLDEDYRIQRGFAHNDYVVVNDSGLERILKEAPKPKSLAFDIEVYNFDKEKNKPYFPRPDDKKNPASAPIICWSFTTSEDKGAVLTHTHCSGLDFVNSFADEKETIQQSIKEVEKEWPDYIYTWNGNNYDWPYWMIRAKKNKIPFKFKGYEVKKKRGGLSYVYQIPGIAEIDFMQILRKIGERTPGKGLKDVGQAILLKDPIDIEGKKIYEYWDNDEFRPTLFKYSLKDVKDLMQIVEKWDVSGASDIACNFLGLFPHELRKTGDEICSFFVKREHKDVLALDDTAFRGRDYTKERDDFSLESKPGIYVAAMFNLDFLHPFVLYELLAEEIEQAKNFRIDSGKYEILHTTLKNLLETCMWAKEKSYDDIESEPKYKTSNKLLCSIIKEFPSLILSERYEWHDKTLAKKYVEALDEKIRELAGDDLLYADWDNIFVTGNSLARILQNSKSEFGYLLSVEHPTSMLVDVQIIDDKTYVYMHGRNNMLYPKGITVRKKKDGPLINKLVEGYYRALFSEEGEKAVEVYLTEAGKELSEGELTKEELLKSGTISKPEEHYVVDSESVLASKLYNAEPFDQFEYGVTSDGEILKAEDYVPELSDVIKQFIKRVEKSANAIEFAPERIHVLMERHSKYNQATLEVF